MIWNKSAVNFAVQYILNAPPDIVFWKTGAGSLFAESLFSFVPKPSCAKCENVDLKL